MHSGLTAIAHGFLRLFFQPVLIAWALWATSGWRLLFLAAPAPDTVTSGAVGIGALLTYPNDSVTRPLLLRWLTNHLLGWAHVRITPRPPQVRRRGTGRGGSGRTGRCVRARGGLRGLLGVLLDYAAGVLSAAEIKAAGALGPFATSPIAGPAPNGCWANPCRSTGPGPLPGRAEDRLNYQFGKQDTADWLGGQTAG